MNKNNYIVVEYKENISTPYEFKERYSETSHNEKQTHILFDNLLIKDLGRLVTEDRDKVYNERVSKIMKHVMSMDSVKSCREAHYYFIIICELETTIDELKEIALSILKLLK